MSNPGDLIVRLPLETPVLDPVSSPELFARLWAVIEGEGGMIVKLGASEILFDSSVDVLGDSDSMKMFGGGLLIGALSALARKPCSSGGVVEREGDFELEVNLLKKLGAMADFYSGMGSEVLAVLREGWNWN